jgi:SAM-dependent methyltransferase
VALRLLADQGWLACAGEAGTDELAVTPTARGRVVMTDLAGGYQAAARFLPLAGRIEAILAAGGGALEPFCDLLRAEWGLPATGVPPDVRHQVLCHLDGHLVAPLMFTLTRAGAPGWPRHAAEILAAPGWARTGGGLTPAGEIAVRLARQYRYPMVYLPLLRSVPELIFGDPARPDGDAETHLDRELDIRFSGEVFAALCRAPFLEIALPLFDREPVAAQPALVLDTGCGDGTLLETLYAAITRTVRGRLLDEHPLLMVGADPSPVARRAASARLAAAGVPHLIMDGDIADPDGLARALSAMGHDARDALHVCKSAIHDRAYAEPPPGPAPPYAATNACARPDGTAIPATDMARNLAEVFRGWRSLAARHGWIVIEAHTPPAQQAASLIGRTLATALDATHGYSCQYPTEPEVFAWAARAGGFSSRAHREPAAAALGHTLLTIDHFVVAEA